MKIDLTDNQAKVLVKLLRLASDEFGRHGCNDFPLPNTDENWTMMDQVMAWAMGKDWEATRSPGKDLYFTDWMLMDWFAHKIEEASKKG